MRGVVEGGEAWAPFCSTVWRDSVQVTSSCIPVSYQVDRLARMLAYRGQKEWSPRLRRSPGSADAAPRRQVPWGHRGHPKIASGSATEMAGGSGRVAAPQGHRLARRGRLLVAAAAAMKGLGPPTAGVVQTTDGGMNGTGETAVSSTAIGTGSVQAVTGTAVASGQMTDDVAAAAVPVPTGLARGRHGVTGIATGGEWTTAAGVAGTGTGTAAGTGAAAGSGSGGKIAGDGRRDGWGVLINLCWWQEWLAAGLLGMAAGSR